MKLVKTICSALLLLTVPSAYADVSCKDLATAQKKGIVTRVWLGAGNGSKADQIFFVLTDPATQKSTDWIGTSLPVSNPVGEAQLDMLKYAMLTRMTLTIMCGNDSKWAETFVVDNELPASD